MIQLDIPRLPHRLLRCPLCGEVHRFPVRMIVAGLLTTLMLASLAFPQVHLLLAPLAVGGNDSSGNTHSGLENIPHRLARSDGQEKTPVESETVDLPEKDAAVSVPDRSPTTVPIPTTAVVWNRTRSGTYLWDAPGGSMVTFIENGLVLTLTDHWKGFGGVPYGEVIFGSLRGWVDMQSVHRVELPEGGFERLGSGRNMYNEPRGQIMDWLPAGTPVVEMTIEEKWVQVSLFIGGDTGWIYRPQPSR